MAHRSMLNAQSRGWYEVAQAYSAWRIIVYYYKDARCLCASGLNNVSWFEAGCPARDRNWQFQVKIDKRQAA